jgi:hypothetical protein
MNAAKLCPAGRALIHSGPDTCIEAVGVTGAVNSVLTAVGVAAVVAAIVGVAVLTAWGGAATAPLAPNETQTANATAAAMPRTMSCLIRKETPERSRRLTPRPNHAESPCVIP